MSVEKIEMADLAEDKEPVYFAPKRASLISDVANILSWVVLVGFIADIVVQVISIQTQVKTQGLLLSDLLRETSFLAYIFTNLIIPLLTGLGIFAVLQAAAVGLSGLLEMDYNARESKAKA